MSNGVLMIIYRQVPPTTHPSDASSTFQTSFQISPSIPPFTSTDLTCIHIADSLFTQQASMIHHHPFLFFCVILRNVIGFFVQFNTHTPFCFQFYSHPDVIFACAHTHTCNPLYIKRSKILSISHEGNYICIWCMDSCLAK